jgi:hypothetical protein
MQLQTCTLFPAERKKFLFHIMYYFFCFFQEEASNIRRRKLGDL